MREEILEILHLNYEEVWNPKRDRDVADQIIKLINSHKPQWKYPDKDGWPEKGDRIVCIYRGVFLDEIFDPANPYAGQAKANVKYFKCWMLKSDFMKWVGE